MARLGTTTSVTLLYTERPILNFARYVENLEQALRQTEHQSFDLHWDDEDYVTFDLDGSRVVLGYADLETPPPAEDQPPPGYQAALVLAVGPSLRHDASARIAENGRALCDSVIERIQKQHGADLILWTEVEGIFTVDHFDTLVDTALTMRPAQALPAVAGRFDELPVGRLLDRLEEEIGPQPEAEPLHPAMAEGELALLARTTMAQERAEIAPAPPAIADDDEEADPANDLPEIPHPMHDEMARIRDALYPPAPEKPVRREKEPMVRRLTIYTFNTTLLMVSLPVGAALLTYNVLGREDSRVTARVMALTGIGMAFTKLMLHGHLPHLGA
jgi:hypothetical protein